MANKISKNLNIKITHLDKIFWKEKSEIKQEKFVEKVLKVMESDDWIIEGSMPRSKTLDIRIQNADVTIFYHLPLCVVFYGQVKRFFKYYKIVRPDMGGNNIQKYPITLSEVKHALNYPYAFLYKKIKLLGSSKILFIIKNTKDENSILNFFQNKNI